MTKPVRTRNTFVGREREMAELRAALDEVRLGITITVGKMQGWWDRRGGCEGQSPRQLSGERLIRPRG